MFWKGGGSGIFGVKDAYILMVAPNDFTFPKKNIWVDKAPTKLFFLLGRPLGGRFLPWIVLNNGDGSSPIVVFCVVVKKKL